ncbi:MAG TPA: hypothetical protein VE996_13385 [Terriglobales bacterium]|nr:hypothetical protein [Terriglobales bacterium]
MSWIFNRREFGRRLAAGAVLPALARPIRRRLAPTPAPAGAWPEDAYTPFGYLDNPFHTWDLHRSGNLRSAPAIGFGFYYPAGPGGYFDFQHDAIYQALLRLGFVLDGRLFFDSEDFAPDQLTAPHHSHLLFTYAFTAGDCAAQATFLQVGEDTLAARVRLRNRAGSAKTLEVLAVADFQHGAADWWGRDGLSAGHDPAAGGGGDAVWIRSFAAGTYCRLGADRASAGHWLGADGAALRAWLAAPAAPAAAPAALAATAASYDPQPMRAALRYPLALAPGAAAETWIWLSRGANRRATARVWRAAAPAAPAAEAAKRAEDDGFWARAPRLEGDWPAHWRRGWVYDFETLRMMVRRPLGAYRHPWDAMQIQAPRNVLAETSLDMWALSHADPAAAQAVVLGQFEDAIEPNVPCMRESGVMNMVAADGSECGTSIAWCYPFFCIGSMARRGGGRAWQRALYPYLAAFVRWTLAHRTDAAGFIVGKCSWETGMDASSRFQIKQPTGAEGIEFIRIVELQAAMAHAAGLLAEWAEPAGDGGGRPAWRRLAARYAAFTQQLWNGRDWFQDFDTRAGRTIVPPPGQREIGQCAPIFLGVARPAQIAAMKPLLRWYRDHPHYYLEWSSFVLPYLESLWRAEEDELRADVVNDIADRIYTSMDRRQAAAPDGRHLGWPGVSCEMWGIHGATGGEGYGWGAVLPAHILRNLAGFREADAADRLWLAPNFPAAVALPGREYAVRNLLFGGDRLSVHYRFRDAGRLDAAGEWHGATRCRQVLDAAGAPLAGATVEGARFACRCANRQRLQLVLARGRAAEGGEA